MSDKLKNEINSALVAIISNGFNRSLRALEDAEAIDTKKLREKYKGIGSEYYDIVTNEIEKTAHYSIESILKAYENERAKDNEH